MLSRGIREGPLRSAQHVCAVLTALSLAAYYALVMRFSDVYVMLSPQLLLIVFDLAYDLSLEYSQLYRNGPLHYNKQYSIQHYLTLLSAKL